MEAKSEQETTKSREFETYVHAKYLARLLKKYPNHYLTHIWCLPDDRYGVILSTHCPWH